MVVQQAKEIEVIKKSLFLIEHQLSKERNANYLRPQIKAEISHTLKKQDGARAKENQKIITENLKDLIDKANKSISTGNIAAAKALYNRIRHEFSGLENESQKTKLYGDIANIYNLLSN